MSMQYLFHAPAYVVFGEGSRKKAGALLKKWGASGNVLLVHGENVGRSGLARDVADSLQEAGLTVKVFSQVQPDAPVEVVRAGVAFARAEQITAIVAIGGGSAMDLAKAIAVMLDNPGDILDYAGADRLPVKRKVILFAIPTTCGTGSEITDGGVYYDEKTAHKYAVWDVFAGPDVALLDPFALESLSGRLIAATAMDAMAHSAEGYTSKLGNPITDAIALGAIGLIASNVESACQKEPAALEQVLTASTMAGISFNRSGVHAGHAIAHALGAITRIHHGTACALALPYVMRTQAAVIPQKVADVGRACGADIPADATPDEIGDAVARQLTKLNQSLGIERLSQYGIQRESLEQVVQYAVSEPLQGRAHVASDAQSLMAYLESIF